MYLDYKQTCKSFSNILFIHFVADFEPIMN